MQDYSGSYLFTIDNYADRNQRAKYTKAPPPPLKKSPFPFGRMKPGQYFHIPLKNVMDETEIASIRSFAHQHARIHNIWIKTAIVKTKPEESKGSFSLQIIHDGERKNAN